MFAIRLATTALLLAAAPALADSPWDGTWKIRTDSMTMAGKPDRFQIKNGVYSCSTCIPAYSVATDGAFHHVAGKDYWDEVAIKVVDDHRADYTYRRAGKVVSVNSETVSADGNTLTMTAHNTNNGGSVPIDSTATATRVGAPMTGAHLISGVWQEQRPSSVSDAALLMTIKVEGKTLHMTSPMRETLDAPIGGAYTLNVGDPGRTMTKVEQPGPRTMKFTDMRAGKVVNTSAFVLSADGNTIAAKSTDPRTGNTSTAVAVRQ